MLVYAGCMLVYCSVPHSGTCPTAACSRVNIAIVTNDARRWGALANVFCLFNLANLLFAVFICCRILCVFVSQQCSVQCQWLTEKSSTFSH